MAWRLHHRVLLDFFATQLACRCHLVLVLQATFARLDPAQANNSFALLVPFAFLKAFRHHPVLQDLSALPVACLRCRETAARVIFAWVDLIPPHKSSALLARIVSRAHHLLHLVPSVRYARWRAILLLRRAPLVFIARQPDCQSFLASVHQVTSAALGRQMHLRQFALRVLFVQLEVLCHQLALLAHFATSQVSAPL
jgi:hypothetical protein